MKNENCEYYKRMNELIIKGRNLCCNGQTIHNIRNIITCLFNYIDICDKSCGKNFDCSKIKRIVDICDEKLKIYAINLARISQKSRGIYGKGEKKKILAHTFKELTF